MINFTVGPVQMSEEVRKIGQEQVPYFRTQEFSDIMKENERIFLKLADAPRNSKALFLTGSGTAAMEASVQNVIMKEDKALVVNGGSFGQRFVELCALHDVCYDEIRLEYGKTLHEKELKKYDGKGYTCLLVNVHETSTGVHYNLEMIYQFCKKNNMLLIVDAISSFLADELSMNEYGIDVLIVGSQKALAVPPGISIIGLSSEAQRRIEKNRVKSLYFDLKIALKNAERGQTPFTPAVGILRQIYVRLLEIEKNGIKKEISHVQELAQDFREKIKDLPVSLFAEDMSNAVTALKTKNTSAKKVFEVLKNEYNIWVCPNGGELAEQVFRVGHIGNLTLKDNEQLIEALYDLKRKGILY